MSDESMPPPSAEPRRRRRPSSERKRYADLYARLSGKVCLARIALEEAAKVADPDHESVALALVRVALRTLNEGE